MATSCEARRHHQGLSSHQQREPLFKGLPSARRTQHRGERQRFRRRGLLGPRKGQGAEEGNHIPRANRRSPRRCEESDVAAHQTTPPRKRTRARVAELGRRRRQGSARSPRGLYLRGRHRRCRGLDSLAALPSRRGRNQASSRSFGRRGHALFHGDGGASQHRQTPLLCRSFGPCHGVRRPRRLGAYAQRRRSDCFSGVTVREQRAALHPLDRRRRRRLHSLHRRRQIRQLGGAPDSRRRPLRPGQGLVRRGQPREARGEG
mmetsp:Transcript_2597/g.7780  ORF Transcript_2597/g.7780 Transcript_2597/m.7780 type:complete len:261 (+) Transcript_2597:551-1333(+)